VEITGTLLVALGAIGILISYALSRWIQRRGRRIGAVVPPRSDRWHQSATPTFGGVAIAVTSVYLVGVVAVVSPEIDGMATALAVVGAAFAMFIVGLADDTLTLTPLGKLVGSLVIGAFYVFGLIAVTPHTSPATVPALIAIIWFGGVVHTLNLLDNMDGLAGGVAVVACLFFAWAYGPHLGPAVVALLVAVSGSLIGFLILNRSPARLFMGDCGSLFIGGILAGTSLVPFLANKPDIIIDSLAVGLILAVPLFDTGFVLVLRKFAGRKATRGGTDHVSHRLVSLGFSERSAVRILYALGIAGGAVAVGLTAAREDVIVPVASLFVVASTLFGIYLARVPAYEADDFLALQKSSFAPFLKDLAFKWHVGQVLLDILLISSSYYGAYLIRFEGEALTEFLPTFTASFPVVLGFKLVALYSSGLYSRSWETFGLRDAYAVTRGVAGGSVLSILAATYIYRFELFSRGVLLIDAVLLFVLVMVSRASFRLMSEAAASRSKRSRRVLIYGAGSGGQMLAREMRANKSWEMNPVGFLDDDPVKQRRWILGLPVRAGSDDLELSMRMHNVDELILSSPSIDPESEARIREVCARHDVRVRRLFLELR